MPKSVVNTNQAYKTRGYIIILYYKFAYLFICLRILNVLDSFQLNHITICYLILITLL